MTQHPTSVFALAEAVADGAGIDWDQLDVPPADAEVIAALRSLAAIASISTEPAASWGPLRIRAEVGRGSYGTVHRAWDARLERDVALKLLHDAIADGPVAAAALLEGRLLARVKHPNVVTVFGADVHDGRVGIWTEFVVGQTLREIVDTQGPLGPQEAALVGRDVCRALAAVHREGILHRDVKAQNVMRESGGRTVLMDFGAGQAMLTVQDGASLRGSPAYLAPEILEGRPPTTQTDIYSVGVLLFYLVSGKFPVVGASVEEIRGKHRAGDRVLLRDLQPELQTEFLRVVDACLEPDPASRPGSAGRVAADLERTLRTRGAWTSVPLRAGTWAVAALLIAVSVVTWHRSTSPAVGERPAPRRDSVAVLPFDNLTGDRDNDYLAEAVTADLIADLAALRDLRVIAGPSTRHLRDQHKTPGQIRAELGVATMLAGSVRRSNDQVRVIAQLIDTFSGDQIWSSSFNRPLVDLLEMRSDVARKIAVALRGELSESELEALNAGKAYDYEALTLYMRGRHEWGLRTDESMNRSIQLFNAALARDERFAPAFVGLADAYTALGVYGSIPREEAYARAAKAAHRAVELDNTLAEAHASLGLAQKNRFEWRAAEASFRRAIELKPGFARAHHWYSILLTQEGRFGEGIAEIKQAMSLDPLSVAPKLQFAGLLAMARRYRDAIAQYKEALALDADFPITHRHLAMATAHAGDVQGALRLLDHARGLAPHRTQEQEIEADTGYVLALAGRRGDALAIAKTLETRYERTREHVAASIAAIYAGLGEPVAAMTWLEKAGRVKDPETGYLLVDPRWDTVRKESAFASLLNDLGLSHQNTKESKNGDTSDASVSGLRGGPSRRF